MQNYYIVTYRKAGETFATREMAQARNTEDVHAYYSHYGAISVMEIDLDQVDREAEKKTRFVKIPARETIKPPTVTPPHKREETLYFTNWGYNAARILQAMEKVIQSKGGYIAHAKRDSSGWVPFGTEYTIYNRTLRSAIRKQTDLVTRIKQYGRDTSAAEKELARLEAIDAPPIKTRFTTYIHFMYRGVFYTLSLNDNPFFPFHYSKVSAPNFQYRDDAYCLELDKSPWMGDCFFRLDATESDVQKAAKTLFSQLVNSAFCPKYRRPDLKTAKVQKIVWEVE